jgi:terminase small subunit-like protein
MRLLHHCENDNRTPSIPRRRSTNTLGRPKFWLKRLSSASPSSAVLLNAPMSVWATADAYESAVVPLSACGTTSRTQVGPANWQWEGMYLGKPSLKNAWDHESVARSAEGLACLSAAARSPGATDHLEAAQKARSGRCAYRLDRRSLFRDVPPLCDLPQTRLSSYALQRRVSYTVGVNAKQRRFVAEYLKDQNGTQAAIRTGYSPKTAAQ